jgi:hypothetical protein
MKPRALPLSLAVRLGVTPLSASNVRDAVACAKRIAALAGGPFPADPAAKMTEALAGLPHGEPGADLLQFVLKLPRSCDAFVFCATTGECVAVSAALKARSRIRTASTAPHIQLGLGLALISQPG